MEIRERNELITNSDKLIKNFLDYIDVSDKTVHEYGVGIKSFIAYCNENNITDVSRQDVINFRESLKKDGKKATTINLYLSSIKSFFKWLEYAEVYKNITSNVKSFRIERSHSREAFTLDEVKTILNNCQNDKEKIMVLLAINCGLRCNEICNIKLDDFQIKEGKNCLYVLGKARQGLKQDFVVVDDRTFQSIKDYVNQNNIKDYLFTSESNHNKGGMVTPKTLRLMFNNILERCGLKDSKHTFHSTRHTNATLSIQNGVDIREVSQNLRHKNINTTMIYLHDIEAINNKCSSVVSNLIGC